MCRRARKKRKARLKEVRRKGRRRSGLLTELSFIQQPGSFYCTQCGKAGEAWAEVRTPVLLPGLCHELPASMALDEFLSFSVFICRRRQSLRSLPALWLHGSYRSLMGRTQRHLSPAAALGRSTRSAQLEGVSFLLTHFTGVETEAWMSVLPNVELSSSLPSLFSPPPHPRVKGDHSHSKTQASVTKDISTSGQQQRRRAGVWGSSLSP